MDALRHADEILAALWLRHPELAMPGHVGSPMDDRATITIPRSVIQACEPELVDDEMRRSADGIPPKPLRDSA
jgi:hypothetical protein